MSRLFNGPVGEKPSSSLIPIDNYKPNTTPYTTPLLVGGMLGEPIVFVPRNGQEGAWFHYADLAFVSCGSLHFSRAGWGAIINFHRHDNAAVVVGSGTKNTGTGMTSFPFGGDATYLTPLIGSFFTYTQTCSSLFINHAHIGVGGNILIAVDDSPYPNGRNLKTVSSTQAAGAEFNASIIASLPAPWNTLSTLEGCKYVDCRDSTYSREIGNWVELYKGAQGSHTVKAAPTSRNSTGSTTARGYITAFGYISSADTAIAAQVVVPRPSVNTSGRTFANFLVSYRWESSQALLTSWTPSGAVASEFVGNNHTPDESSNTGYYFYGALTNGSIGVTGANTHDLQDGDKLVALGDTVHYLTAATPTGKTATTFNLAAAPTIAGQASGATHKFMRADWTITTGATSITQAFSGTHLPAEGDSLWICSSSTSVYATVISVSGSNVTLDASVTTVTGDYVVLLGTAKFASLVNVQNKANQLRPFEIVVPSVNAVVQRTQSLRSHTQIGTTLSSAAARGDTTVAVTSATNLVDGDYIAIYGTTGRFVSRITGISGTTITLARKLPMGFASGSRATYGKVLDQEMRFRTGGIYALECDAYLSNYRQGDGAGTLYTAMLTVDRRLSSGYTYTTDGTATARAWADSDTTGSVVSMQAVAMSGLGISAVMKSSSPTTTGRLDTRQSSGDALTKTYFTSVDNGGSGVRNPSSVDHGSFFYDIRDVTY